MTLLQKIRQAGMAAVAAAAISGSAGCVSTDTTEMAVVYCKWLCGSDKAPEVVPGGRTQFYIPFRTKSYTLSTQLQTLAMTHDPTTGDRQKRDDIIFKSQEGNDIGQDVVLTWKLDVTQAQKIVEEVGTDIEDVKEKYVRPIARSIIRDYLSKLESKAFYEGQNRFTVADEAKTELKDKFKKYGLLVDQVNVQGYRFEEPKYQQAINDAKNAGQDREKAVQEIESQTQHWIKQLETQRGVSNQQIAEADGKKKITTTTADAYLYQSQEKAKAIVKEKEAEASNIKRMREAMASSGGETAIQKVYVDNFNPEEIHVLPCYGKGNGSVAVQRFDVNQFMQAEAAREAAQGQPAKQ